MWGQNQDSRFRAERMTMVDRQIRGRDIRDAKVLKAMEEVPRHLFVPEQLRSQSYGDHPLPIGEKQTISQPYIVALMTSLLELEGGDNVLEIGTGSGYQAAVLSRIAGRVSSIEIIAPLARRAESVLDELGYENVDVRVGDGYGGWADRAPFDAVIVTAAPERIPEPLIEQLVVGGRMVIPVGRFFQELLVITKTPDGIVKRKTIPVRFVPMTGEIQNGEKDSGR